MKVSNVIRVSPTGVFILQPIQVGKHTRNVHGVIDRLHLSSVMQYCRYVPKQK